jgi:hypothetical protein
VVQQCIVHLIRNCFRCAGRQHRDGIVKALKPVYTAPREAAAKDRFASVHRTVGPAVSGDRAALGVLVGFSSCRSKEYDRPHRRGQGTLGDEVEAGAERV